MLANTIQNPVVQERLSKFTGTKQGTICPTVGPELIPIVIVDDLSRTGKGGAIASVRPWAARAGGTAADFPFVRLVNANAQVVQRVRKITICSTAVGQPVYLQLIAGIATGAAIPAQKAWLDTRLSGTPAVDLRFISQLAAPVLTDQFFESRLVNGGPSIIDLPNPIVLAGGTAPSPFPNVLIISLSVAGSTLQVTIEGEEESMVG